MVGREDTDLVTYLNDGSGGFTAVDGSAILVLPCASPSHGDLDGDGDLDLLAGTLHGGPVYLESRETDGAG